MVPGPTQVLNPNGSSIGAAVFAGLTSVTDRQTDHATRSVRIGRIYVRSTVMRPNNSIDIQNNVRDHFRNLIKSSMVCNLLKFSKFDENPCTNCLVILFTKYKQMG